MHINEMYPSNYLKAADLNGHERTLKISSVTRDEIGGERKNLLGFAGAHKKLVLNKTNARVIAKAYGNNTESWLDKPVTLYETQVDFKGDLVPGIRIKVPMAQQSEMPLEEPPFDDNIPAL
jgi:hypothetical protein